MTYEVLSERLRWPAGSTVSTSELQGCNIDALIDAGHLALVAAKVSKTEKAATAKEHEAWHASS
jgi:ribosomal protein L12E/L44/L45/RPP1/RPP2